MKYLCYSEDEFGFFMLNERSLVCKVVYCMVFSYRKYLVNKDLCFLEVRGKGK